MMSLYEIDTRIKAIIDSIYEAADEDGVVEEIDFTELKQLQEDRKAKLENIALYIKNTEAEAAAIKAEEEKLTARRKRLENKAGRLREYVINSMKENKDEPLKTARCEVSIKDNEKTDITDLESIPEEFIKVKTERNPDKKAIKKAIKAGQKVPGAQIIIDTTLTIK